MFRHEEFVLGRAELFGEGDSFKLLALGRMRVPKAETKLPTVSIFYSILTFYGLLDSFIAEN